MDLPIEVKEAPAPLPPEEHFSLEDQSVVDNELNDPKPEDEENENEDMFPDTEEDDGEGEDEGEEEEEEDE